MVRSKTLSKRTTIQGKAGIVFPAGRLHRLLKTSLSGARISQGSAVYLAAVLEYLTAEILELTGNAAKQNKKLRLLPRHILLAVETDSELNQLLKHVVFPFGGVLPHVHSALMPKNKQVTAAPKLIKKKKQTVPSASVKTPKRPTFSKSSSIGRKDPSIGLTILNERTLFLGQKLTVVQGDISNVSVDAVVHPTNSSMYMGGQVGSRLRNVGGSDFETEVRQFHQAKGDVPNSSGLIMPTKHLRAKFVVHCNGPTWGGANSVKDLDVTVKKCLQVADNENILSVAFPSIGSGSAGFPKQTAAETILRSIKAYFAGVMSSSLRQVFFVLYDKESVDVYIRELDRLPI